MALSKLFGYLLSQFNGISKTITVATDCSGIEAPLMALDLMNVKYKHIFSSEVDSKCIDFINRNFKPEIIYNDLKLRDNSIYRSKSIDLYIAGFPCQSFSSLGRKEGFDNEIKGTVYFYVYDFIRVNRPNIFILENVRALETHDKGKTFQVILDSLADLKEYDIQYTSLNTMDYGIPQSRTRLFIVGIKHKPKPKPKPNFEFPTRAMIDEDKVGKATLSDILDNEPEVNIEPRHAILMGEINEKYPDLDFYSSEHKWILNLNVSSIAWFRRGQPDISPCIVTNSKYYIPSLSRYLTAREALKLQGIPWKKYNFDFSTNVLYKFAGNTISVNVIMAILIQIFNSVGGTYN
jgi:DNA (cytosine-5)-methyltransferase 1